MSTDFILQNPNLLPPDEVRIERVTATPTPDGRRVQVQITVTPFRERPNLEIEIAAAAGHSLAMTSAIAIMNFQVTFNLHLRGTLDPDGEYRIHVQLYYADPNTPQDSYETAFSIPLLS